MLVLVAALGLGGCTYTVRLLSDPPGAVVTLPNGRTAVTPVDATFRWGQPQPVTVTARGYRPLEANIQRTEGRPLRYIGGAWFQQGGREVTFQLTKDVPAVGTAAPGEADE